ELAKPGGVFRLLNSPAAWKHRIDLARGAVKRARDLEARTDGPVPDELRQELQALEAVLEQQNADWRLARRLEQGREDSAAWIDGHLDYGRAVREYPKAFEQAGLNVLSGQDDAVVADVRRSAIKEQLLAALDGWAAAAYRSDETKDLYLHLLK